ncbi:E3 ubiquitin-protein ligase UPL3 [Populus alba x Populus x berolinensis]|nr:E3 ubiquitin-protein ligase UPL3 [Populus alba x Populus x berolinensis]
MEVALPRVPNHFNRHGMMPQHSSSAGNAMPNGTEPSESADDDLPSVMTCANYLKLPPYSTKDVFGSLNFAG